MLTPQILQKLQLQRFDLTDDIFAELMGIDKIDILVADRKSIENKIKEYRYSNSTIALYAITGKFNIYYIPSKIYVRKLPFFCQFQIMKLVWQKCIAIFTIALTLATNPISLWELGIIAI